MMPIFAQNARKGVPKGSQKRPQIVPKLVFWGRDFQHVFFVWCFSLMFIDFCFFIVFEVQKASEMERKRARPPKRRFSDLTGLREGKPCFWRFGGCRNRVKFDKKGIEKTSVQKRLQNLENQKLRFLSILGGFCGAFWEDFAYKF